MKGKSVIHFVSGLLMSGPLAAQDLLIFGGNNHQVFLGCINCSEYDNESICNEYGMGNEYSTDSIFNEYGRFGNEYASESPWNEFSTSDSVPVVVDRSGNFYGFFTINSYRTNAVAFSDNLSQMYEIARGDLKVVRNLICE